ncbi:hypothetical protein SASPL_153948 [Salvia splendens]|uniref:Pentatricopeptide repeat-containing protein n=1 Tax=Salvia splendens TaxID=180675 RepID=A0A8X8VZ87_SALSN|nr:hypothetical protein SASPL_153948 [Salvia splendens]
MEKGEGEARRHGVNALIKGHCKSGNLRKSIDEFEAMLRNGSLDEVREVSLQMRGEPGWEWRFVLYSSLIDGFGKTCEGGCLRRWPGWAAPVTPAVTTVLIDALAKTGKVYEVVALVRDR